MTNKRMHQLERKVRVGFKNFNQIIYPKNVGINFLEQIRYLMFENIRFEHYRGNITISELHFMARCLRRYYWYYRIEIDKNFE